MDPIAQGLLGAAAAQAFFGKRLPKSAWLIGLAGGMAADLDILIRSAGDPLGGLMWHRHFTHALVFIPLGGLICALPFLAAPGRDEAGKLRFGGMFRGRRWAVLGAATAAYATHGLLDACTSYGTHVFWPFTDARTSWDVVGIIDPVVWLALLIGVVVAVLRKAPRAALAGLLVVLAYFGLGAVQRGRALEAQRLLAAERGHDVVRGRVLPQPLTLLLWRSIYETRNGRLHADSMRAPFFGEVTVWDGSSAERLTLEDREAGLWTESERETFARFSHFADGFVARDGRAPDVAGDMRYALRPDQFSSMWGLALPGSRAGDMRFVGLPGAREEGVATLWDALVGRDERFVPLSSLLGGP